MTVKVVDGAQMMPLFIAFALVLTQLSVGFQGIIHGYGSRSASGFGSLPMKDIQRSTEDHYNHLHHADDDQLGVQRGLVALRRPGRAHNFLPQGKSNSSAGERSAHRCRIWVPVEAVARYGPWASRIQMDQASQLLLIEICCPGFRHMRWRGTTLCRPICHNCRNGLCLAPERCQCYEEFVKNDNGDCVFTCPLGCLNGRCYLDGTCRCDVGFKLDETRKFCRPICSNGCGQNARHNCTGPEICGCRRGYQLTDKGCVPICRHNCGTGGTCKEPDMCECQPGLTTLKDGVCQSECYQKCDNGVCYSRNRCICNAGFSYHEKSTQCIPT